MNSPLEEREVRLRGLYPIDWDETTDFENARSGRAGARIAAQARAAESTQVDFVRL